MTLRVLSQYPKSNSLQAKRRLQGLPELLRAGCLATVTAVAARPRPWKKRTDGAGRSFASCVAAGVAWRRPRRASQAVGRASQAIGLAQARYHLGDRR